MAKPLKKIVFIDAMALAYKAYFAFINRPLKTMRGEPTSAVYGFLTQFLKIMEDIKPDYAAVAFDSKEKTFRHELYSEYKANRQEIPEDLIPQIARIKEVVETMNIPVYIFPGYEADDLIGAAAKKAESEGFECFLATPDKDYLQLAAKNIKIVKPGKSVEEFRIYDEKRFKEEFGFKPENMIDYLALIGDASDNIPGVPGIGEKTASPLIQKFGTIENIYKNIDKIEKQGVKNKLIDGKDSAFKSKELVIIKTKIDYEFDLENARLKLPDLNKLFTLFRTLEFKNISARVNKIFNVKSEASPSSTPGASSDINEFDPSRVSYRLISTIEEAKKLSALLASSELFVFDVETDSLNIFEANLAGVAFALKPNEAYFTAVNPFIQQSDLFDRDLTDRLSLKDFIAIFRPVFEDEKIKKVCQNGKFDSAILKSAGIEINNLFFDTMLASYLLDPDQKHGMNDLSIKYLNYSPIKIETLIGAKKDPSKIFDSPLPELSNYSCEDADITYRLYEVFSKELKKENLDKLAYKIEFPLVEVLEDMERTGIKIDVKQLNELSEDLQKALDRLASKIYNYAGETFNINSTQQLQKILYQKLGLTAGKKTKTGYSTDARSLENLLGEHPIIDELIEYRQAQKLKSTYADALPNMINPKTGRIHTSFNQTAVSTGRLSSADPNLQNIPIRTESGKEIRRAFIPGDKNRVLLSADYSQIELRILASLCKDNALINAFKNNEDIHRATAAIVFNLTPEKVTPEMRRKAKEVNFGILYGIGPFGLKTRLGITQTQAKEIIDDYFNKFKSVKSFIDLSIEKAQTKGYAETILGRRRYLKNINSKNKTLRQFEERVAVNMPIQGTAADMIKIAMINIFNELKKMKAKTKMALQVHDELLFDAHKGELNDIKPMIKELMENALKLDAPISVETGIGDNWLDAH